MSLDFISGAIKSWDLDNRIKIVVSYYSFIILMTESSGEMKFGFFMARYQTGICQFEVFKVIDS